MQLYNVTWKFPEIEGQKAAYVKLIEYVASGAEGDHIDGFELMSRTHCPQTGSGVVICKAESSLLSPMKKPVHATRSCSR